jgi:uncharacterized protein YjlB
MRKGHAMSTLEKIRKIAEKATGWRRPSASDVTQLVHSVEAETCRFEDDGIIPNHPSWPLIVYPRAVQLPAEFDPAAVFEQLFASNGWGSSWRNGIYDYAHYHSRIHEVLGIARGRATVRFGGAHGRVLELNSGDVAILPAGTGHQRLQASNDLLVVGAYPASGSYDKCTSGEAHAEALKTIPQVARPDNDPVYGGHGQLLQLWSS